MADRPRLLDLFCGAGGAGVGYHLAGFDVTGVDIAAQPDYPFDFHQEDALEILADPGYWTEFDAIHASPPCQRYTAMKSMWNHKGDHPDLIGPVREWLVARQDAVPWVMENVPGAPMEHSIMLCGTMFGLCTGEYELRRHRLFETSFPILGPTCQHTKPTIGIYGDHARDRRRIAGSKDRGKDIATNEASRVALAKEAMGMPWITRWRSATEAIPPAYTEFIGTQLLAQLCDTEAAT